MKDQVPQAEPHRRDDHGAQDNDIDKAKLPSEKRGYDNQYGDQKESRGKLAGIHAHKEFAVSPSPVDLLVHRARLILQS